MVSTKPRGRIAQDCQRQKRHVASAPATPDTLETPRPRMPILSLQRQPDGAAHLALSLRLPQPSPQFAAPMEQRTRQPREKDPWWDEPAWGLDHGGQRILETTVLALWATNL